MGKKAESLEPCWSSLELCKEKPVTSTNNKASVTKPVVRNKPTNDLKLDLTAAQFLNDFTLDTPEVDLPKLSSTDSPNVAKAEEEVVSSTNSEVEVIYFDDEMDCVEKEEVVETSENPEHFNADQLPKIVLTQSANLPDVEDVELSEDLLTPGDFMEECTSDHGYESYDSPISEPEELVSLFPELCW